MKFISSLLLLAGAIHALPGSENSGWGGGGWETCSTVYTTLTSVYSTASVGEKTVTNYVPVTTAVASQVLETSIYTSNIVKYITTVYTTNIVETYTSTCTEETWVPYVTSSEVITTSPYTSEVAVTTSCVETNTICCTQNSQSQGPWYTKGSQGGWGGNGGNGGW
jgi:hypothetical protein